MLRHHESATFVLSNSICNSQVAVVLPNIPFIGRSLFNFITMASCDIIIEPNVRRSLYSDIHYPICTLPHSLVRFALFVEILVVRLRSQFIGRLAILCGWL